MRGAVPQRGPRTLRQLRLRAIEIDRLFTQSLDVDYSDRDLVCSMVEL